MELSFFHIVVLDSFNKASRDEENILNKIYKKQICSFFYFNDFNFK